MNVLVRALRAAWDEANKPAGFVKGDEFEQYVRATLFPRDSYDLLSKTHDYRDNKADVIKSSRQPDYHFRSNELNIEFFVEAKYRSVLQNQAIEWGKYFQLKRYQKIDNVTPVLIVIGLGGRPSAPEKIFLMPVKHIKFVKLYPGFLEKYRVAPGYSISDKLLKRILA
jgi:hypothetical protein